MEFRVRGGGEGGDCLATRPPSERPKTKARSVVRLVGYDVFDVRPHADSLPFRLSYLLT